MVVNGIEVHPVDVRGLKDMSPVYIVFEDDGVFSSQWGIVDQNRQVTIHKDFTISFNERCRYYGLAEGDEKQSAKKAVIVQF